MKRIFSIITLGIALLATVGCKEEMPEVIDEISLGRCLTPTNVVARVQNGEYIYFSADQSKATEAFVIELFNDTAMEGTPVKTATVAKEEIPYLFHVDADEVYYLRTKAVSSLVSDSKWYVFEKSLQTTAIKSSLAPEVTDRTENSIAVKWTADPEVDHLRLTPVVNASDDEYTRIEVSAEEIAAGAKTITGLSSSVKYTVTVHFKSADRGSVSAWTLPNTAGATKVLDTAAIKQAIKDGATKLLIPFADTTYVVGEMALKQPLDIYGEQSPEGAYPTIAGRFTFKASEVTSLHVENLRLSGAAEGNMSLQTHLMTVGDAGTITSISFLNCEIDGYKSGIYYDNYGASVSSISFDNVVISNIEGDGGDCFDVRKACTLSSVAFTNSTIYDGLRTFIRIDANATLQKFELSNCTLSNLVHLTNGNTNGLLHIRAKNSAGAAPEIIMKKNLFLNFNYDDQSAATKRCTLIGTNTADWAPSTVEGNFFYNCEDSFFNHAAAASDDEATTARKVFDQAKAISGKGGILSADPTVDSGAGKFNVTATEVMAAGAGDPRWYEAYVEIPEDLTQAVTKAVKTWNFADGKTFYKAADKDMVRDGIRFYVKNAPVVFSASGLALSAAGTVDKNGVPTDCALSIKVDEPGSVVVSTSGEDGQAILAVSLDGKVKAAVPVGTDNMKIVFDAITAGEEHMIYLYGTAPITVSALQWSDDIDTGGSNILDTPAPAIDLTSVNEGEDKEITVSWEAVAKAGSYDVAFNGKTDNVTDTKYVIAAKTLKAGEYTVSVTAKPAATDLTREPSEAAEVKFTVVEVLKPVSAAAETVWGSDYMTAGIAKYGTGELTAAFVYGNLGYVPGSGKFKFGTDNADTAPKNRIQLGGTGAAGTKSCIQFIAGGAGTLKIIARSSGDASSSRPLAVAIGTAKVASYVTVDKGQEPAEYTYEVNSAAGDMINIYSESSGINLYSISWTPKAGSSSSLTDETAINEAFITDYTNTTTYPAQTYEAPVTIEKITYYGSAGKGVKWASNRFQFVGKPSYDTTTYPGVTMPTDTRYATFKITKPGTVTIQFYSGGSSNTGRNGTVVLETNVNGTKSAKEIYSADTPCTSSATAETITISAEDLAGITESAVLYFFSKNNTIQIIKMGFTPAE